MEGINWEAFWWGYAVIIGIGVMGGMLAAWAVRGVLRFCAQCVGWIYHGLANLLRRRS